MSSDREELQLKTFSYHLDVNEEDEVNDPLLNKPGSLDLVSNIAQYILWCAVCLTSGITKQIELVFGIEVSLDLAFAMFCL